jgi:hypothetical protein
MSADYSPTGSARPERRKTLCARAVRADNGADGFPEEIMTKPFHAVALAVVAALLFAGPLAPLAAAQQPQADAFKETMKGGPHEVYPGDVEFSQTAYDVAAGVATTFLVPGRVITCAAGSVAGLAILALTFGSAYRGFADVVREGCGGKWVVRGEDLAPDSPAIVQPGEQR